MRVISTSPQAKSRLSASSMMVLAVIFTGGVGENCAPLRDRAAQQFKFLPNLRVLVIHAEEEWEIARQCFELQTAVPT